MDLSEKSFITSGPDVFLVCFAVFVFNKLCFFIQYFKRVALLASIVSLPSGPL